jgi:hypothetical protein
MAIMAITIVHLTISYMITEILEILWCEILHKVYYYIIIIIQDWKI